MGILDDPKMQVKKDPDGGNHPTSKSLGLVYSDAETDAAGQGPEDFARQLGDPKKEQEAAKPASKSTRRSKSKKK